MLTVLAYLAAMALAEAVGIWGSPLIRAIIDSGLVVALLLNYGLPSEAPHHRLLLVLVLAPLMRLISLIVAVPDWPALYSYALVGAPMLVAAGLTARHLELSPARLGLGRTEPGLQLVIALSGVPLGMAAFALLRPPHLLDTSTWAATLAAVVVLMLFGGFLEELIFRGLFQQVAQAAFGAPLAIVLSNLLFATLYLGSQAPAFVVYMAGTGLFFGYCVHKTDSLYGVLAAHCLMTLTLVLFLPAVISQAG